MAESGQSEAVAGLLRLSWDEIHASWSGRSSADCATEAEPVTQIGVDEKAFRKGQNYLTLVNDLLRGGALRGRRAQTEQSGRILERR